MPGQKAHPTGLTGWIVKAAMALMSRCAAGSQGLVQHASAKALMVTRIHVNPESLRHMTAKPA